MTIQKFTRTEETTVVFSPEAHQVMDEELQKLGKTSARKLTAKQRKTVRKTVDKTDSADNVTKGQ